MDSHILHLFPDAAQVTTWWLILPCGEEELVAPIQRLEAIFPLGFDWQNRNSRGGQLVNRQHWFESQTQWVMRWDYLDYAGRPGIEMLWVRWCALDADSVLVAWQSAHIETLGASTWGSWSYAGKWVRACDQVAAHVREPIVRQCVSDVVDQEVVLRDLWEKVLAGPTRLQWHTFHVDEMGLLRAFQSLQAKQWIPGPFRVHARIVAIGQADRFQILGWRPVQSALPCTELAYVWLSPSQRKRDYQICENQADFNNILGYFLPRVFAEQAVPRILTSQESEILKLWIVCLDYVHRVAPASLEEGRYDDILAQHSGRARQRIRHARQVRNALSHPNEPRPGQAECAAALATLEEVVAHLYRRGPTLPV